MSGNGRRRRRDRHFGVSTQMNLEIGEWTSSGDRGYNSRPFWVVHRYNRRFMFSIQYLSTKTDRKRFYNEERAVAMAAKLNAESVQKDADAV